MRKSKFILGSGLLAMLSLTACSNDDPVAGGEEALINGNVYVAVRIHDASSLGGRGTDGGYQDAVAGEHEVGSADFYFYDENGLFVSKANVWNDKDDATTPAYPNVQFNSTTVVVLKDLKQHSYPKYVVTILNQPANFTVAEQSTMADMKAALSNAIYSNGIKNENGKFVMATTSYQDTNHDYYFATELFPKNFAQTEPSVAPNPQPSGDPNVTPAEAADIYVERLAAKVSLAFGGAAGLTHFQDATHDTYYKKLTVTVAGDDNNKKPGDIGAEDLYIHILGWGLNATAKNTHMVKTIATDWGTSANPLASFTGWNNANDHRSFWGKSYNYDVTNALYPGDDATTNPWTGDWVPGGANGYPLNYLAFSDITSGNLGVTTGETTTLATPLYCAENTNTGDIVSANGSAITSVLIAAQVTTDEKGDTPLNMVLYRGVMYTKAHYINYMLNRVNQEKHLNFYYCEDVTADPKVYKQIEGKVGDISYVDLVDKGNGQVGLDIVAANFTAANLYKYVLNSVSEKYEFVNIDGTDINNFKTALADLNPDGYEAIAYTDGKMYYNIPIEHLGSKTTPTPATGKVNEAVYGIVRNHSYVISVNKIANLGHGVFDPDKKIITTDPTPDQKLWQVGATINILSWKLVNQGVDL